MYAPSRVAAILKDGQAANRSRQANGRLQVILYMILLAAHLAVVWLLPFFPTQDGPSHVYNLVVYRDLLQGKGAWDRFYVLNERSISNQGFFLIAYPLLSVLTPGAAERAFLSLYVFLLGAGVPLFLRTFGRPALPASFFLFVVVFNRPLLTGFYSNSIGVPLLLLAIAVVWKTRGRSWVLRFPVINAAGFLLFAAHPIPFGIFLLAIALLAAVEAGDWRSRLGRLIWLAFIASPCLSLLACLLARGSAQPMERGVLSWWQMFLELAFFSGASFSPVQLVPGLAALLLFLAGAARGVRRLWAPGEHRFTAAFCGALLVIYFVAPDWLLGGGFFKMRLPPLILLLALPLLETATARLSGRHYAQLAVLIAVLALVVNIAVLREQSLQVSRFVCGLGLRAELPAGATFLTARFDQIPGWPPDSLLHVSSYYGLRGAIDLGNYAGSPSYWPYSQVRFREAFSRVVAGQAYAHPRAMDWSRYPQVQYLLCWKATEEDRTRLAVDFSLYWEEGGCPLTIWRKK